MYFFKIFLIEILHNGLYFQFSFITIKKVLISYVHIERLMYKFLITVINKNYKIRLLNHILMMNILKEKYT